MNDRMCKTCQYSFQLGEMDASCQRFPPVAIAVKIDGPTNDVEVRSFWPTVSSTSSCGEYRERK